MKLDCNPLHSYSLDPDFPVWKSLESDSDTMKDDCMTAYYFIFYFKSLFIQMMVTDVTHIGRFLKLCWVQIRLKTEVYIVIKIALF